ncbi:MAG TPA: phosphohydrolase [Candidatus Choladocola avistercoris]|nr:phosphohydrolase [Candidatus Choladocola avistercoris]
MKNTMTTFTGRHFDPMQIKTEDICMEDIAHALSLMCRGGGHLKYFYSVAQHSLNCAAEAKARGWSERLQLACLLHDASEAYLSDIIRPVKANLTGYLEIENRIMGKILEKFNLSDLTEEEHRKWKQIDDEILYYELKNLMPGEEDLAVPELCALPDISQRDWQNVETDFLRTAHTLISVK